MEGSGEPVMVAQDHLESRLSAHMRDADVLVQKINRASESAEVTLSLSLSSFFSGGFSMFLYDFGCRERCRIVEDG
jgi:hypothetical protein